MNGLYLEIEPKTKITVITDYRVMFKPKRFSLKSSNPDQFGGFDFEKAVSSFWSCW